MRLFKGLSQPCHAHKAVWMRCSWLIGVVSVAVQYLRYGLGIRVCPDVQRVLRLVEAAAHIKEEDVSNRGRR